MVSKRGCFFRNARARNTHVEATLNHPCPAQVGAGGWRSLSAQRVSATNAARDFSRPARSLRESIDHGGDAVRVHKRVSIAGLAVVDVDAADNAVPVLRSADLELRLVLGRGARDGALRAVDVDVFAPPLHALSAALPVSLSLAARVAVSVETNTGLGGPDQT